MLNLGNLVIFARYTMTIFSLFLHQNDVGQTAPCDSIISIGSELSRADGDSVGGMDRGHTKTSAELCPTTSPPSRPRKTTSSTCQTTGALLCARTLSPRRMKPGTLKPPMPEYARAAFSN